MNKPEDIMKKPLLDIGFPETEAYVDIFINIDTLKEIREFDKELSPEESVNKKRDDILRKIFG